MMNETTGMSAYEKLVLTRLDQLETRIESIDEKLVLVRIDVAQLKVKAGIWGAAAGMIPALVTAIAAFAAGVGGG